MKVAFLTNIVSPYRAPVFRRLADQPGWELRVFINAASEFDRQWDVNTQGLDVQQSKSISLRRRVRTPGPVAFNQTLTLHLPTGLGFDLRRFQPDVVISHELGPRSIVAAAYCKRHGIPLVLWSYQSRVSATQGGRFKTALRRSLLQQADAVVGMGTQAREVLRAWGAEDDQIFDAPNTADHQSLLERSTRPDAETAAQQLRAQWGAGRKIAVVIGRMIPLKGIAPLLDQWQALPENVRAQWRLVFVGDGPLSERVHQRQDPGIVHAGHADTRTMADWYRAADLHIFPTLGDVWGLVAQEAGLCGLPTLCSVHAGCSDDLIRDGYNGLTYDPVGHDAVARLQAALDRQDLDRMGLKAQRKAKRLTVDRMTDGFVRAVQHALASRTDRPVLAWTATPQPSGSA